MALPSPAQLGFNAKFKQWRNNQAQAVEDGITSEKRFVGQALSIGGGKSLVYVAQARIQKCRTMILTSTKGLQTQLMTDFSDIGLVDIRGKSNYNCMGMPGHTCEEGGIGKCLYSGGPSCSWGAAKIRSGEAQIVTTNYSCWASTNRYGKGFGKFDLLVMDEAHAAEDALCKALKITLSLEEVKSVLKFNWPDDPALMSEWKPWATIAKRRAELELQSLNLKIDAMPHPTDTMIRNFRRLSTLKRKLTDIAQSRSEDWCVERWNAGDGFQFDPIRAEDHAEEVLFCKTPKVLFISGTIRPHNLKGLGINPDEFDFFEYPRDVNPSRTPLIYIPTVAVDRNTPDWGLQRLVERIDEIIESRADRRGIIHTGNFRIRDFIVSNSKYAQFMISNYTSDGDVTADIIKRFKTSSPPTVLVTPSVTTGYDFAGDSCRYQIIAKLPFPDLHSSKVERERVKIDPDRGISIMWQHLAQAFGRPDRSEEDWAECVDPNVKVLTSNLTWEPAGDLRVGDGLFAFDEQNGTRLEPRRWRQGYVIKSVISKMPRVRVVYEDGEMICTPNHPWLVKGMKHKHQMITWVRADELKLGQHLCRLIHPWKNTKTFESGYLSGFSDGEGCLMVGTGARNPDCMAVILSQNPGNTLDYVLDQLKVLGFRYAIRDTEHACKHVWIGGGFPEIIRFLGQVRSGRLLAKFMDNTPSPRLLSVAYPKVLAVESMPPGDIASMQTSTKTFVAEGMGAHNTFVLDSHIENAMWRHAKLAPPWLPAFFRKSMEVPVPTRFD